MKIRLAMEHIQIGSIVDGEGIRGVIWTQGCSHNCPGCHNPSTHSFDAGYLKDVSYIFNEIDKLELEDGITLTGGDPMFQIDACSEIAKYARKKGLNVWCYTGFTFEQLLQNPKALEFLKYVDVLIDGRFVLEEKSLNLPFRGSKNQRIINVKRSLALGKASIIRKYSKEKKHQQPFPISVY